MHGAGEVEISVAGEDKLHVSEEAKTHGAGKAEMRVTGKDKLRGSGAAKTHRAGLGRHQRPSC